MVVEVDTFYGTHFSYKILAGPRCTYSDSFTIYPNYVYGTELTHYPAMHVEHLANAVELDEFFRMESSIAEFNKKSKIKADEMREFDELCEKNKRPQK